MENPAIPLTPIVARLFEIAGDTRLPKRTRDEAYFYASKLRGYILNLISKRFDEATPQYTAAMKQLQEVSTRLKEAKEDVQKIMEAVKGLGTLAGVLDRLLKAAASLVTSV